MWALSHQMGCECDTILCCLDKLYNIMGTDGLMGVTPLKYTCGFTPINPSVPINLLAESLPPTHLVREHPRPHQFISSTNPSGERTPTFISGVTPTNPSGERTPTATSIYKWSLSHQSTWWKSTHGHINLLVESLSLVREHPRPH